IVTSPPYPNAYDYHLYQRFRLLWLGADPTSLRRVEIGSHLRSQASQNAPAKYLQEMRSVLDAAYDALVPGRYAVLIVRDAVFNGEPFETAPLLEREAREVGFEVVARPSRRLPSKRRTIGVGRRLETEHLLVLRKPVRLERVLIELPAYAMKDYEKDLFRAELKGL